MQEVKTRISGIQGITPCTGTARLLSGDNDVGDRGRDEASGIGGVLVISPVTPPAALAGDGRDGKL